MGQLPFSADINNNALASVFNYTSATYKFYWFLVNLIKADLQKQFNPDGFNIGINVGEAAGQSIFHCHIHIIPRYKGDVEKPRGGVRGVVPSKQKY